MNVTIDVVMSKCKYGHSLKKFNSKKSTRQSLSIQKGLTHPYPSPASGSFPRCRFPLLHTRNGMSMTSRRRIKCFTVHDLKHWHTSQHFKLIICQSCLTHCTLFKVK